MSQILANIHLLRNCHLRSSLSSGAMQLNLNTIRAPLQAAACILFTPFFTAVYIVERLVFEQGNSSMFEPKSCRL